LEFTKLSMLTGDMKFYDAAERVAMFFELAQNGTSIPGLWPKQVDTARMPNTTVQLAATVGSSNIARDSPNFTQAVRDAFVSGVNEFSLGGESDSAYEYIPKMYLLLGGAKNEGAERYLHMYSRFVDTALEAGMWFRPLAPGNPDVLLTGTLVSRKDDAKPVLKADVEHLGCFTGGMLGLGSRLLLSNTTLPLARSPSAKNPTDRLAQSQKHLQVSQAMTDGCAWAYAQTLTGIAPERFSVHPCSPSSGRLGQCLWNTSSPSTSPNLPAGFASISDARYHLRPEAIESVFYLWRITGQKYLQEVAWEMFEAIEAVTATEFGNAEIKDVNEREGGSREDKMESFFLAETMKYFYLMFCGGEVVGLDEWVFNTEAHPFRIAR
jgi:mannosyl-oligosaccharide alpha-1,2-mannosidase